MVALGTVTVNQINEVLLADLSTEEVDTIGGWLYGRNPSMDVGDTLEHEDMTFKLLEKEPHRFKKLEIIKHGS
ncbi:hypothetical protein HMSSN139_53880 [Paenibacillus sp. HMSSN-139]|nr:hypothetical protein HMSSN139_53880 [Paenibacillus sp. HMSSN-139]